MSGKNFNFEGYMERQGMGEILRTPAERFKKLLEGQGLEKVLTGPVMRRPGKYSIWYSEPGIENGKSFLVAEFDTAEEAEDYRESFVDPIAEPYGAKVDILPPLDDRQT